MYILTNSAAAWLLMLGGAAADPQVTSATSADEEAIEIDEVMRVRGSQQSMSSALARKRDSIQLVDSIVAEDIGKLPNNNVVEALQYVPGVQVGTRSAGELAGLSIRGLGHVVTTINGRQVFSSSGRGFALQDIPATMVASMDVFKTASADMVEGGIGGAIDIQTRRPLDFEGSQVTVTGKATYSDQSQQTDPNLSLLLSQRWQTGWGDVGALVSGSFIRSNYRDQIIWGGAIFPYDSDGNRLDSTPGEVLATDDMSYSLVRDAIGAIDNQGDRRRPTLNMVLEWAPTETSSYYVDATYIGYRETGMSQFLRMGTDSQPLLAPYEYFAGTNVVSRAYLANPNYLTANSASRGSTDGYQYGLGGEWALADALDMQAELFYQSNTYTTDSQALDIERQGDALWVEFNPNGGGQPAVGIEGLSLDDPSGFVSATYFDRRHRASGRALSGRVDFDYFRPLGWVDSWQFGARAETRDASSNNADAHHCEVCGEVDVSAIEGLLTVTPGDFFSGDATYPERWVVPSAYFMRNNPDLMRDTFANTSGEPAYDPAQFFAATEDSVAVYGQVNLMTELAGHMLDGMFGVRVVHTDATLSGFDVIDDETASPTEVNTTATEVLPNLTLRYQLGLQTQLRLNASRTVTRPNFGDLNPTLVLRAPANGQSGAGEGHGGNPDLQAVEANNLDIGAEYYFGEGSAVYSTWFYRDIENWIIPTTATETIAGQTYNITRPTNAGSGSMQGIEFGLQYFPQAVPDWLLGIGVQGSYTYIDAQTEDAEGEIIGMEGVSRHSASAVLVYEKGPFSARLSHTYRDAHLTGYNQAANMPAEIMADDIQFTDFSMGYEITDNLIVSFDATNVFGSKFYDYFGDAYLYNRDVRRYSRTFSLGVRYTL
ncbi:MAG: TonB-dependent receptor [Firmicutes bacterium]|nr:TonB-dependent receptor [Bacillota bacterium]